MVTEATYLEQQLPGCGALFLASVATLREKMAEFPDALDIGTAACPTCSQLFGISEQLQRYPRTSTPYSRKRWSAVTTVMLPRRAVAMMKRSAGSLWCSGRALAENITSGSNGAMSSE